jgi:hypothetical protein
VGRIGRAGLVRTVLYPTRTRGAPGRLSSSAGRKHAGVTGRRRPRHLFCKPRRSRMGQDVIIRDIFMREETRSGGRTPIPTALIDRVDHGEAHRSRRRDAAIVLVGWRSSSEATT